LEGTMSRARGKPTKNEIRGSEEGVPIEQCLLVQEEIWRVVSDVARTETRLSLEKQARKIAGVFPAADLSPESIVDALVFAAVDFGVAVEPAPRQPRSRLLSLVGKKKTRGEGKARPTFAGVPIPATT
jgi:hypothetical protein